jgi:hypothetical protein
VIDVEATMKDAPYEFFGMTLDEEIIESIRFYVKSGLEPGSFLTAVICNDLKEACARADRENIRRLPAIVAYFYNETPSPCWGSRARMDAWMSAKMAERKAV